MRVLVCGGRDFNNEDLLLRWLDSYEAEYGPFSCLIEGGAKGADTLAKQWALDLRIPIEEYPADWLKWGKRAGPLRNEEMLLNGKPDIVIAFPGGKGTANMIGLAEYHGVKVIRVESNL